MHNIETIDGTALFFSAREVAWHRLGVVTPQALTTEEALETSHLGGWDVRKTPLYTSVISETGVESIEVPGKFATVRTNPITGQPEALGVVGEKYSVLQNESAFEVLDNIVDQSGAHFETAGSLGNGSRVFVTLKLDEEIQVGGEDAHDLYLLATNSHDGSSAVTLAVTPVRVVCQNTLAIGLARARQSFSIRHTTNVASRVDEARRALDITWAYAEEFTREVENLLDIEVTRERFEQIIAHAIPEASDSTRSRNAHKTATDTLRSLFHDSPTNEFGRGTAYAAFNAITEYADWFTPVKGTDPNGVKRATRNLVGVGPVASLKDRALALVSA